MLNWSKIKITGKDEMLELARKLDRPKTKIAREIVLAERAKDKLRYEAWQRGN